MRAPVVDTRYAFPEICPSEYHGISYTRASRWGAEGSKFSARQLGWDRGDGTGHEPGWGERLPAVGRLHELDRVAREPDDVYRAVGRHRDLGRAGVADPRQVRPGGLIDSGNTDAFPGGSMVRRAGEAQRRAADAGAVVPGGVDVAVVWTDRVVIGCSPLLVIAGARVNEVRRAPGATAIGRFVHCDPDEMVRICGRLHT